MLSHGSHGWSCGCWHYLGVLLWLLAVAAFVFAWIANVKGAMLGFDASKWYADALILGVLAIPLKMKGHGTGCACGTCK